MDIFESKYTAEDLENAVGAVLAPFEEGEKAEYDRFWDAYQENGNRIRYESGFSGLGWTAKTFRPKYNLVPQNAYQMFYLFNAGARIDEMLDMVEYAKTHGFVLDLSKATNLNNVFQSSGIRRLGVVDTTSCASATAMFVSPALVTIDEFIMKADGTQTFGNSFAACSGLRDIKIKGAIGKDISFPSSNLLSDASVQSIIDHLKDLTGQTAQTVTFHNTVGKNMTAAQKAEITAKNWTLVY